MVFPLHKTDAFGCIKSMHSQRPFEAFQSMDYLRRKSKSILDLISTFLLSFFLHLCLEGLNF